MPTFDAIEACLLGMAVGDAIGLPRESMSRRRAERIFGAAPLRHRLVFGYGTISDDTEHACLTAQAILDAGGEPTEFARKLARRLRWWFAALPPETGLATAKACLRLWCGWPAHRSGSWSAGNGAAMRAPLLGVYFAGQPDLLDSMVDASTLITHRDPRAIEGARMIARAAAFATTMYNEPDAKLEVMRCLQEHCREPELSRMLLAVADSLSQAESVSTFAERLGLGNGVNGYICHTTPIVLHAWLSHTHDLPAAVESVIVLGGDTDTHGAIVGALTAITAGAHSIPEEWLTGIVNYPTSITWIRRLAQRLADRATNGNCDVRALKSFWPAFPVRNLVMLTIILAHGFRRLLPPY